MIRYEGCRTKAGPIVTVNGDPLDPRQDLYSHSPDGFEWGYPGSRPAQLALAILADHLGDDEQAINLHQRFKWALIAKLPERKWTLTAEQIDQVIQRIRDEETKGECGSTERR
jgi:hypothetical protein